MPQTTECCSSFYRRAQDGGPSEPPDRGCHREYQLDCKSWARKKNKNRHVPLQENCQPSLPKSGQPDARLLLFSYAMGYLLESHSAAASSAPCSACRPPSNFVRGQASTMWDIVWISPQSQRSLVACPHRLRQALHWPCAVRKRFRRHHWRRGRSMRCWDEATCVSRKATVFSRRYLSKWKICVKRKLPRWCRLGWVRCATALTTRPDKREGTPRHRSVPAWSASHPCLCDTTSHHKQCSVSN